MDNISFKRSDWIIVAVILIFIICVILWEVRSTKSEVPEESRVSQLTKRLKALEEQVEREMDSLKLTQEMKLFVDKKIRNRFMFFKVGFTLLICLVSGLFYFNGQDVVTSALSSVGVVGLVCGAGSFLFLNKFVDPNSMIAAGRELIRKWVYKKYGFDPLKELRLKQSIVDKQIQTSNIKSKIEEIAFSPDSPQD